MNIMGVIIGMVIFAMVYVMFSVTTPIMNAIITWGHTQNIDSNAWSVVSSVMSNYNISVIVAAAVGIIYIIYSQTRTEVETRYA